AIGLGHSGDTGSVMYAYLSPGQSRRTVTTQDLSVLEAGGTAPEPLLAAPWHDRQTSAQPAELPLQPGEHVAAAAFPTGPAPASASQFTQTFDVDSGLAAAARVIASRPSVTAFFETAGWGTSNRTGEQLAGFLPRTATESGVVGSPAS